MSPPVFRRAGYSQIVLTLTSFEPLGLMDTDYLEDIHGVDGQVTLTLPDGTEREVVVTGLDSAHERFRAFLELGTLPDGLFIVRGRARDTVGNEAVFSLPFQVAPGFGTVVVLPGLSLTGLSRLASRPLGRAAITPVRVPALATLPVPRWGLRPMPPAAVVSLSQPLAAPRAGQPLLPPEALWQQTP